MSNNFVIGGGWSVTDYADQLNDLMSFGHVIGVNDASIHASVHEAITMDRLWFENRYEALARLRVQSVWVREKCDCNVPVPNPLAWRTFKHFNQPQPSEEPGVLHGGNSGTCGINLAFQRMQPGDNLFLLGFDMQKGPKDEPYWYPPYPWARPGGATRPGHFTAWVRDMRGFAIYSMRKQFNVFNVTTHSAIPHFPKIDFDHMIGMLHGN